MVGQTDAEQNGFRLFFGARQRHLAAMQRGREHVLENAHMSEGLWNLIGAANTQSAAIPRFHRRDVAAAEYDAAAAGRQDPGDHIEQCSLTRPVRTQNADNLALLDLEVQLVDDNETAESARQRSEFKHRCLLSRALKRARSGARHCFRLATHRNVRRQLIINDDQLDWKFFAFAPLSGNERRQAGIGQGTFLEIDGADDGFE